MQKKVVNILFPSIGRRVELLRAFRRAYQELQLEGTLVGTDIDPLASALQETDTYYLVPRTDDPDFVPTITAICKREEIALIFPLIDPDIPVLAGGRERIERTGARVVVVPETVARVTADKWATYSFLKNIGMDTPCSWLPEDLDPTQLVYPVFIKPRFGSASKHTFKVHNEHDLELFIGYVEMPIIQEYLDGPEITNDVICDLKGRVLGVVSRQRIEVRWGEVAKGVTVFDPVITDGCIRIAKAMQAIGPITVQCIMKNGQSFFIDINARYGGGAPLGIAAGVPSPQWYLSLAAGRKVDPPPLGSYQTGLYISRYDQAFFLSSEEIAHAENHHL